MVMEFPGIIIFRDMAVCKDRYGVALRTAAARLFE
jgi:hypothetical protein